MTDRHLIRPGALAAASTAEEDRVRGAFPRAGGLKKQPDGSIDQIDINFHAENNGITPEWFKKIYDPLMGFNERRIASMNESNIAYAFLSLQCPGTGAVTDKQKAQDMARAVNDALAEKISEHPHRSGSFTSLAVHDGDKAAKELERCMKKLGFKG